VIQTGLLFCGDHPQGGNERHFFYSRVGSSVWQWQTRWLMVQSAARYDASHIKSGISDIDERRLHFVALK
jgi:hypothetical protein